MSVRTRRFAVSVTALAFALTVAVAPAAKALPSPPSKALPVALDAKASYQGQVSCDPRAKPGLTAFATLMKSRYKTGTVGTYRPCQGDTSEHYDGRAMDWTLNVKNPQQRAVASSVLSWLSARDGAMARRFGISYMIWNHKVWKAYRSEKGWTKYTGSVPHTDHVHLSFTWDGAMKRTSWWTGRANTVVDLGPCRVYAGQFAPLRRGIRTGQCAKLLAAPVSVYKVAVYGQRTSQIAVAQRLLHLPANGQFGSTTFTKVVAWQAKARIPVTGVLDKATWRKLTGR